jgi:APA family basic amino acid/polyamine antiporter
VLRNGVLLYVGVQVVCIGAVTNLAASRRPIADAAYALWGGAGQWIVSIAGLVIMFGTLFAVLLTASRLPFAFAENGQMPERFAAVHSRFRTPWVAIILT